MPIFRFLAPSSLMNTSRDFLLRRFGFCRRFQCRNYSTAQNYNKERIAIRPPVPEKPKGFQSRLLVNCVVPAGFLLIAGAGFFIHYNDERRVIPKGTEHARNTLKPTVGGSFSLIDSEGRPINKHNLLGNWVLLYFGYTSSPDVGPVEVQKMARAIEILESKHNVKLVPIFVTIDPQRDSPSQLRAYLNEFDSRIIGLTGPISTVRQLAREYRVYFKKVEEDRDDYLIDTSHNMYLLDLDMDIASRFGVEYTAEQLSEEILMVMSGASK